MGHRVHQGTWLVKDNGLVDELTVPSMTKGLMPGYRTGVITKNTKCNASQPSHSFDLPLEMGYNDFLGSEWHR